MTRHVTTLARERRCLVGGRGAGGRRRPSRRTRKSCSACSATAPGPTADRGHCSLPGLPRLHRPREQQGRRRGPQDQGPRDRPRVQGAAGHGGARALQEGRRGAGWPLRHAADCGADQEARGGQDPRHLAGLRHRRRRRRQALSLHLPDRGQLLVAGRSGGGTSPRSSSAAASRARRSPISSTTIRPARSRSTFSRTSPRAKASSSRPSPFPRPGVEMGAQVLDITGRYQAGLRHRPPVRRRAVGVDQGAQGQGLSAEQGDRVRVGLAGGRHQGGRRLRAWPRATTPCSSPVSATTSRCSRTSGDVQGAGQAGAEGDGSPRSSTTAAS